MAQLWFIHVNRDGKELYRGSNQIIFHCNHSRRWWPIRQITGDDVICVYDNHFLGVAEEVAIKQVG
jgi:hypothetical protein